MSTCQHHWKQLFYRAREEAPNSTGIELLQKTVLGRSGFRELYLWAVAPEIDTPTSAEKRGGARYIFKHTTSSYPYSTLRSRVCYTEELKGFCLHSAMILKPDDVWRQNVQTGLLKATELATKACAQCISQWLLSSIPWICLNAPEYELNLEVKQNFAALSTSSPGLMARGVDLQALQNFSWPVHPDSWFAAYSWIWRSELQ